MSVGKVGGVSTPALHPDLNEIAFLIGTWSGPGLGSYPTIDDFGYTETLTFGHVGKPFIAYSQRTTAADDGRPLHAETGYLRPGGPGRAEMTIAQPTGFTELLEGDIEAGPRIVLISRAVNSTTTAKEVTATERRFELIDGVLVVSMSMAAVGVPMTHHLRSDLTRTP